MIWPVLGEDYVVDGLNSWTPTPPTSASPTSQPEFGIRRASMTTPPIYMPGDDEYEDDVRDWETSTPTTLESPEYWTKHDQWNNMSLNLDTLK